MRLSEYLEIGRKMKTARTNAGISQRDMAIKLGLSNSSYSNYENGYSEPPAEIIIKFCDILKITMGDLLELKVAAPQHATVRTFADLISILIDLTYLSPSYSQEISIFVSPNFLAVTVVPS